MRVLVTGATGFVGRQLVGHLSASHHVIALARRQVSIPGASETRTVSAIDSRTDWDGLLEDVDVVVHLAARVHVMNEKSPDPLEAFREVNSRGTQRLAESAAKQGVKRFVFMSSIKVNGEQTNGTPFTATSTADPRDPYGVSKWEAEQILGRIAAETGMRVVVLRPTVIYGVGVKGNVERIVRLLRTRIPLPLGAVRNRRTMLSMDNLSRWVSRAISEPDPPEYPVLIGDPEPISTRTLASALGRGLGVSTPLLPVPVRLMEFVAGVLGRSGLAQRLFGDLEVAPSFEAFPGIRDELVDSSSSLRAFGEVLHDASSSSSDQSDPADSERPLGALRILVISQYYPPEGAAAFYAASVARGLSERGHAVRVLTGYPNYPSGVLFPGHHMRWRARETEPGGVEVLRVPLYVDHSQSAIRRLLNYVSFGLSAATARNWSRGADVVYVYATQMTPAIGPWLRSMFRGAPYVLHVQDLWPDSITGSTLIGHPVAKRAIDWLLTPWLRSVYRRSAAVVGIAPTMVATLISRGSPPDATHLVYNWGSNQEPGESTAPGAGTGEGGLSLRVLYAGNVGDMQDLETVIRAAQLVADVDVAITIVGDGVALPRIRDLASELGVGNVRFEGRVELDEMARHYGDSDFSLVTLKDLPAFRGTIPSKFQASLAHGVPVITTVQGDLHDLVQTSGVGYAVAAECAEALATAIRVAAASTSADRIAMGARASSLHHALFSTAAGISSMEEILRAGAIKSSKNHSSIPGGRS